MSVEAIRRAFLRASEATRAGLAVELEELDAFVADGLDEWPYRDPNPAKSPPPQGGQSPGPGKRMLPADDVP